MSNELSICWGYAWWFPAVYVLITIVIMMIYGIGFTKRFLRLPGAKFKGKIPTILSSTLFSRGIMAYAVFIPLQTSTMWFCTARTGYTGLHWFKATCQDGKWANWEIADFRPDYEVGELHITADGQELYFHSSRAGGKGQYDIWVSRNVDGEWQPPQNVGAVNSPETDGWPSLTQDGDELWFTRTYMGTPAIFRSKRVDGIWQEPELIISQFAGESSVDNEGNTYFTHHFFKDGVMLEADIYVARRK